MTEFFFLFTTKKENLPSSINTLFPEISSINIFQYELNFSDIKTEYICNFIQISFIYVQRFLVLYWLSSIIYLTIFIISSMVNYMSLKIDGSIDGMTGNIRYLISGGGDNYLMMKYRPSYRYN